MEMGAADQGPSGIGSAAAEGHKSSQQQDCEVLHDQKIAGCLTSKLQWPYRIAIPGFRNCWFAFGAPRIAGNTEIAKLRSVESNGRIADELEVVSQRVMSVRAVTP